MAKGINKVILVGNLGQDPELRYMPQGGAVANLSIATSETYKDKANGQPKEVTEWHRVVMYGKLAEIAGEYLRKGSKVYIEGKLKTRKWQDQQGIERYTTEIIANEMQMLDGRESPQQSAGGAPAASRPKGGGYQKPAQQAGGYQSNSQRPAAQQRGPMEPPIDFDSEIPF